MVIVRLMGGLGNQMFQYAAARNMAIRNKMEVKLDISALLDKSPRENFTFRDYELEVFNIKSEIASSEEIKRFLPETLDFNFRIKQKLGFTNVIKEHNHKVSSKYFSNSSECYLWGYWQNDKYFESVSNQIIQDFTVKDNYYRSSFLEFQHEVQSCNSVAIHIRRGDYVLNEAINKRHGSCSIDYYLKSIELIKRKVADPKLYIFSDDLEWSKRNIITDLPTTFSENSENKVSFEDMYLMSLCKHNIIANSSYSWWGAWLNQNKEKIVIAPNHWFNNKKENNRRLKALPDNWQIL